MKGFWSTVIDENGQVVGSCSVSVYSVATGNLATIYSDEGGTAKTNPFNSDEYGRYSFFIAAGKYYIRFEKTGFDAWTSDYITIPDEVDETDIDTIKNKYVSNNMMKDLNDVSLRKKSELLGFDNIHNFDKQITWLFKNETFDKLLKSQILGFDNIQSNIPSEVIKHVFGDNASYTKLLGRAGGQILYGGIASGEDLTFYSTSHATRGTIFFPQINYSAIDIGADGNPASYALVNIHWEMPTLNLIEVGLYCGCDAPDAGAATMDHSSIFGSIRNYGGAANASVAIRGQGYLLGTTGGVWGLLGEGLIDNAAYDGSLKGAELGIYNLGTDETDIDANDTHKVNLWLNIATPTGWNPATAAIAFSDVDGANPGWHYGLYMRRVGTTFIHMANPGSGAIGINMPTNANWSVAMILPNNSPISFYNAAGVPKNMFYLDVSDGFIIGTELATGKLGLNVDGTVRQVTCGANDSGGSGYRYLRVPNPA